MKPVQVAPWAVDDGEPMMSVSQAAYRGGKPLAAKPGTHNAPPMNAKEMKAKMEGLASKPTKGLVNQPWNAPSSDFSAASQAQAKTTEFDVS